MVMITRSAYKKATQTLNSSDISQKNIISMPPWCSSGKVYERRTGKVYERRKPRKTSPSWETQASYALGESVWDHLNDRAGHLDEIDRNKKIKQNRGNNNHSTRRILKLLACILIVLGLLVPCWFPDKIPKTELLKSVLPDIKLLTNLHSTSVSEECCNCHRMRHLTVTLSRIEQEMRQMLRLRNKIMLSLPNRSTNKIKARTNPQDLLTKRLVLGARAVKGSSTQEWGAQVALWGVVPLWRTAPPPDTILALRKPKPSDCWPFGGSNGEVIIELPRKMLISSLSVEHIRPDSARSAPKNFVVYGILGNGTYVKAADGTYRYNEPAKQFYSLHNVNAPLHSIVFRVLSNQGNPKYTCIYRVQVYGNDVNKFII